ncbi:hypothetical protein BC941DRAFT_475435 [Chlamydoabsidia padenii]|nr:hypothetical protein BC941DRAFT_475435 [Chlamydoabsidia padenii]
MSEPITFVNENEAFPHPTASQQQQQDQPTPTESPHESSTKSQRTRGVWSTARVKELLHMYMETAPYLAAHGTVTTVWDKIALSVSRVDKDLGHFTRDSVRRKATRLFEEYGPGYKQFIRGEGKGNRIPIPNSIKELVYQCMDAERAWEHATEEQRREGAARIARSEELEREIIAKSRYGRMFDHLGFGNVQAPSPPQEPRLHEAAGDVEIPRARSPPPPSSPRPAQVPRLSHDDDTNPQQMLAHLRNRIDASATQQQEYIDAMRANTEQLKCLTAAVVESKEAFMAMMESNRLMMDTAKESNHLTMDTVKESNHLMMETQRSLMDMLMRTYHAPPYAPPSYYPGPYSGPYPYPYPYPPTNPSTTFPPSIPRPNDSNNRQQ